jgi:SET domain-containing protein
MNNKIYIAPSNILNAGRGVFAAKNIKKGEVIEVCPILLLWDKDATVLQQTKLQRYVFEYTKKSSMLALGYGSLYNHNDEPNALYELLTYENAAEESNQLYITALKPILKNEEIYINYGNGF